MSIATLLSDYKVRTLTGGDESQSLGDGADIVLAKGDRQRIMARCANEAWRRTA